MSGFVNVRLSGARTVRLGSRRLRRGQPRRLGSSQAFGSTELVQTWVTSGQRLAIQGCRRSGCARAPRSRCSSSTSSRRRTLGTPSLVRVKLGDGDDLHELEELGLDVTHNIREGSADVVLNTAADRSPCSRRPASTSPRVIADLAQSYDESRAADAAYAQRLAGKANLPSGNRTSYRELADYEIELKQLAEKLPEPRQARHAAAADDRGAHDRRRRDRRERQPARGWAARLLHRRHAPRPRVAGRPRSPMEFAHLLAKGYGSDDAHHVPARRGPRRDRADPQQGRLQCLARGEQDLLGARPVQRDRRLRDLRRLRDGRGRPAGRQRGLPAQELPRHRVPASASPASCRTASTRTATTARAGAASAPRCNPYAPDLPRHRAVVRAGDPGACTSTRARARSRT